MACSSALPAAWQEFLRKALRCALGAFLAAIVAVWFGLKLIPLPAALFRPAIQSLEFTDRHGATLRETRVGERFAREIPLDAVPVSLVHAMLAAEDKRFFSHHGVDLLALARSLTGNLQRGHVTSGASTITEQLVKIAAPRPRTWRTKLIEAAQAVRLEQVWSKDRILAAYLNRLDFGKLNVGCAAAAADYFGKPLSDLSEAEAAFLAGLPKNPARLNPRANLAAARRREQTVLRRMRLAGWLTEPQFARARVEGLRLQPPGRQFLAPHFIDFVLREARADGAGSVTTTLDLDLHRFVENTVRERLANLRAQNVHSAAVVVLENRTGEVLDLVGSENYFAPRSGQVNGAIARRSAGSTIKPFTYLLALERGALPSSVVADVPAVFPTTSGLYRPENYNKRCSGPVRYRIALANSLNIPAVKVLASIGGAAPLQRRLQAWGLTTLDRPAESYGLGLTIGNAETRLIELTNAYATLARLGEWKPYCLQLRSAPAEHAAGGYDPASAGPIATRDAAWLIADILRDNAARASAFGMHSVLRFDFPVACKTGTSTDFRDNWAVGYTPEFTVGVWVGNFDGSPMRQVSGVTGAAPILHAVFEHLHARFGTSWYPAPPQIVEREIHPMTGKLLLAHRLDGVREKFLRDHLPETESPDDYDASGRVKLSAEYVAWSKSPENTLTARSSVEERAPVLHLVSPQPGTTFLIDPDLPSSRRLPLEAAGSPGLVWHSDSLEVSSDGGHVFAVGREGQHRLTVSDPAGNRLATWIRVKSL